MRLDLVVGRAAGLRVDAVDPNDDEIEVQACERLLRQRSDELVGLRASRAAGDDQLEVGPNRELARDVQRVRHDGQPLAIN